MSAARHRREGAAGFTIIELTVALVAGLIVAIGIVTLSKEATRTFHEEVRTSAAEATMRMAVDRLTADLARAGYMSTSNITADPKIAHAVGATNVAGIDTTMKGILGLASLHLIEAGSTTRNILALSAAQTPNPALTPDVIDIGGNMTSSEEFDVYMIGDASGRDYLGSNNHSGCRQILLSSTSAAIDRVNNGPVSSSTTGDAELANIFQPLPPNATNPNRQFIVRLVDATGRSQFLATCPIAHPAGISVQIPYVWVDTAKTRLITDDVTGGQGGVPSLPAGSAISGSSSGGGARINPVQIVRWEITQAAGSPADTEPPQYVAALANSSSSTGADPLKYDLMRSFVDATGAVVPETSEIVAEYAIDLDFVFSVDTGTELQPVMVSYAFDEATNNKTWADDVTKGQTQNVGPQRIRSVRTRIVTRTAQADRSVNLPAANFSVGGSTQEFTYRYCLNPNNCSGNTALQWARARTVTAEVSLPNQARNYY